jgi:dihydroorotase
MSESILIRGGHLIDPAQKIDEPRDILLVDGKVAEVAAPGKIKGADKIVDAKRLVVAPGFIDLHVHLREPGQSHKETIKTGTMAAAEGGFTSVCAMPNTAPINDSPALTRWMMDSDRGAVVNVFPIAAATVGSAGEKLTDYRALQEAGAVGVTDDGRPVLDDNLMAAALGAASKLDMVVIQHAEDTRLSKGGVMNLGATSFRLGLRGQPPESEFQLVERDVRLAHDEKARMHVAHISTAQALEYVKMGKRAGARVTCEVCPHHFLFTEEDCGTYDTSYKMNPPLRTAADREALLRGIEDGAVDAIATDHAPHAQYEKFVEFDKAAFGITGLEVALGAAITHIHRARKVPLSRIIQLFTSGPASVVSLAGRGTLKKGSFADVTIFDPKKKWTYDVRKSRSKARNAPYHGMDFYGRVIATIVCGQIVFDAR